MAYTRMAYDPWETAPKERSATFVGRTVLLDQLLSTVGEQRGHGTVQHYLLLGPPGIGKTSILLTLRDRIGADPTLSSHWFSIQLREEEYFIRTLRDLLDLTLQALAADENIAEAADLAERVHKERNDEKSLAIAVDGLRAISRMHNKRILLLIDNFDRVFPATATGRRKKRSPDNEYRAFRKLLSTESFLMVIGASARLFEEIATYDQAFFNFFCPIEIPPLSDDEIYELLFKCADMDENSAFRQNLHEIKDKVRAITYMTGGNPRLVLMLYDVLRQREMLPIVQALRETVGGLTPMLKHILDDMPRQQSKTLDALVRIGGTASPSSIARLARLPLNVVTAQLGRLKDARFVVVEGMGKGKPATYRLSDPMFRTWYQMRYLRPAGRRIELFVEFLRAWFSVDDRKRFLEQRWQDFQRCAGGGPGTRLEDISVGIEYYAASLEDERERQVQLSRLAEGMFDAGHSTDAARLMAEFEAPAETSELGYLSAGYRALGNRLSNRKEIGRAIEAYSEALKKDPQNVRVRLRLGLALRISGNHERARMEFDIVASTPGISKDLVAQALVNRGITKGKSGDSQGAIADYTAVVELAGAPAEWVAKALRNRGVTKGQLGDSQGAIADYTVVVEVAGAPAEVVARTLVNRGFLKGQLGDSQGAIADYTAAVELAGAPAEQVARALVNRGFRKTQLGDSQGAIADYTTVVELAGAPAEQVAKALFNRGSRKGQLGDSQGAIADYTAVVELAGAPAEQVAKALVNRGSRKGQLGDSQGAIADYTAVVELAGAPAEQVAKALVNRGFRKGQLGDSQGEIADYTAVVELAGAPAEQVARALVNRGFRKTQSGDSQGAITDYTVVAELAGASAEAAARALVNRGITKGELGDSQAAIADYTAVVELAGAPAEQVAWALISRGFRKGELGDSQGEIADYTAVVELAGAPAEQVAKALVNRGITKGQLGDSRRAIADYTAAVELAGAPAEQVAKALVNRGITKGQLGDSQGEIADYTAAVELAGAPAEQVATALVNRGTILGDQGNHERALEDFNAALALGGGQESLRSTVLINRGIALLTLGKRMQAILDFEQCLESKADTETVYRAFVLLIGVFLQDDRLPDAVSLVTRLHEIEPAGTPVERRLEVRISVIVNVATKHSLDAAAALLETAMMHDPDAIRDRLGFLKPAIEYARTGREQVLANLPDRERDAAREIAVTLLEKESRDDRGDPIIGPAQAIGVITKTLPSFRAESPNERKP